MAGAWYLLLAITKNEAPMIATQSWEVHIKEKEIKKWRNQ